jgi:formate dehydrogenase maturation protein FdhE
MTNKPKILDQFHMGSEYDYIDCERCKSILGYLKILSENGNALVECHCGHYNTVKKGQ